VDTVINPDGNLCKTHTIGNRSAEHRLGTMENQSRHAEAVLGAPVLQRSPLGWDYFGG